jgi:HTH-type transcriptional regulator, competence development regulator
MTEPGPSRQPEAKETFGQFIRRLRREHDLTQRELARRISIDFTYLSKLENDRGERPGEDTVKRLADELGANTESLLALAGKVPASIRELALEDAEFARFLRRLPEMSDEERQRLYDQVDPKDGS